MRVRNLLLAAPLALVGLSRQVCTSRPTSRTPRAPSPAVTTHDGVEKNAFDSRGNPDNPSNVTAATIFPPPRAFLRRSPCCVVLGWDWLSSKSDMVGL